MPAAAAIFVNFDPSVFTDHSVAGTSIREIRSILAETGLRITPEAFLDALAPAYARWEATLCGEGFGPLRAAWLSHAARLGETIRARTGQDSREGVFEGIDATGNLILRTPQATLAIPAAEVFF